jgi:transcriptional regulator with XRE-family HTH domain
MSLAENVRTLREQRGWTQAHLAELIGLEQPRISEIENGRVLSPRISTIQRLAGVLGVSQGELCGESLPILTSHQ